MMVKTIFLLLFISSSCLSALFAQTTRNYTVILRSNTGTHTLWDGNVIDIFGFAPTLSAEPTLPAQILYAEEGDTVVIRAWSVSQGDHHTIHLHGLDVDTRNDGDPMTSFSLEHMQDTTYTFVAHNAGTYIYHCHVGDVVHVQMGMYGLIVVKAKGGANTAWTGGPAYNKDYKWLMSEVDKYWHDNVPEHDTINDIINLPPYNPGYFLINGKSQQQLNDDSIAVKGAVGEKIYMRLANIGFFDNQVVFPSSLNAVIIASDGRPLPASVASDTVYISPGERYGVMLTPDAEFTGTIDVEYINMNTLATWQTEKVPVSISGFIDITEVSDDKIGVFPNPASDLVKITLDEIPFEVTIDNNLGREVLKKKSLQNNFTMNVSGLPAGIYYLTVRTGEKHFCEKLILVK